MRRLGLLVVVFLGCAGPTEERNHAGDSRMPPRRDPNEPRDQLDRGDIVWGMHAIEPAVRRCFERYKQVGFYEAMLRIAGEGRVTAVHVRGPDVATNDCVGHAVATATFPRFSGALQTIVYPYVFR